MNPPEFKLILFASFKTKEEFFGLGYKTIVELYKTCEIYKYDLFDCYIRIGNGDRIDLLK
jgi:hypothetical protein